MQTNQMRTNLVFLWNMCMEHWFFGKNLEFINRTLRIPLSSSISVDCGIRNLILIKYHPNVRTRSIIWLGSRHEKQNFQIYRYISYI